MFDHMPHTIHPSHATPPPMPTPRTGSHRDSLLAVLLVATLAAGVLGVLLLNERAEMNDTNAARAEAMVVSLAEHVNSDGPFPARMPLAEAVGQRLADSGQLHGAPHAITTTKDTGLADLGLDAEAAYLVDVDGQLACLLLTEGRADAYAHGDNVTASGPSDVAPTAFDCRRLIGTT